MWIWIRMGWERGEVWGGETIKRIYCMKKFTYIKKKMVIRMNRNPMGTCTYVAWTCGIRPLFGDSLYYMKRISPIRDRSLAST